jgi:hypothetical protein
MNKPRKKNRTYARYRWREKHKKQYTFTKTKFAVGFVISVLTSVFLGSYFDKYGKIVIDQSVEAIAEAWEEPEPIPAVAAKTEAEDDTASVPSDIDSLDARAKAVNIGPIDPPLSSENRVRSRLTEPKVELLAPSGALDSGNLDSGALDSSALDSGEEMEAGLYE